MDLTGEVGGIPIEIHESPNLPSPGETSVNELGGGLYEIESFFDISTELTLWSGPPTRSVGPTRLVLTPGRLVRFEVVVGGNNESWNEIDPDQSKSDGWANPNGQQWFECPNPQTQDPPIDPLVDPWGIRENLPARWWSAWDYNDPYDRDRMKIVKLIVDYKLVDPTQDGFMFVAINWSTTDWSLNPPAGTDTSQQPPLSNVDPANPTVAWVGRYHPTTLEFRLPADSTDPTGTYDSGPIQLPIPYNPEWVSIDVRGYNFRILDGKLFHECVEDPGVPPELPDIIIEQLNWIGLATFTPYSTWGRVTLDYNEPPGIYYFNMSLGGATAPTWVIQNLSIETPGGAQTLMAYLDLGVPANTNVASVDYGYSITPGPINVEPPIAAMAWVPDLDFQLGGEGGVDLGSPSPPETNTSTIAVNPADSGVLADKDKFVNQPQGKNQCAPGAISNSLKYLQATGKIPAAIPTGIGAVGAVVGTTANGTPQSWYKKKATHYKKHVNTRWIEAPLTVAKVRELAKELKDGQDIEVDLDGHVQVLGGIRLKPATDGTYTVDLDLWDDNQTDKKSDPMHTSPLMENAAGTQQVDGRDLQRFVIECPKRPLPDITCPPYVSLDTWGDYVNAIAGTECSHLKPMEKKHGIPYMAQWQGEGVELEYPERLYGNGNAEFLEARPLEAFEGDPNNEEMPDDGGVAMIWGGVPGNLDPDFDPGQSGHYASALRHTYGADPDLSNSIITVVVTAPQFGVVLGPNGTPSAITQVSLGLESPPVGSGAIRSWYWNCGNTGVEPIQWGVPTTLKIDTSIVGTTAATPTATNFFNTTSPPAPIPFDITNVLSIIVDENANWVGGTIPAPAPGSSPVFMWNYWHWLMVSPKTTLTKGYFTKWSQGPIVLDTGEPPLFWGWDEPSDYHMGPVVADDWLCEDKRPITDFHWWGSFPGWREPYPPCHPKAFHLGIWTDAPAIAGDVESYSHPDVLVWEHICDSYVSNFAGYDRDPRQFPNGGPGGTDPGTPDNPDPTVEPTDSCFQYNQLLTQDDWFYQDTEGEPNRIYWLSIAPIWDYDCDLQWGWKTRPHFFEDNAVSIQSVSPIPIPGTTTMLSWPPVLGSQWVAGVPLQIPAYDPQVQNSHSHAVSWDLAFELTTIEPSYKDNPIPGDINLDGVVDLGDAGIMAGNWGRSISISP